MIVQRRVGGWGRGVKLKLLSHPQALQKRDGMGTYRVVACLLVQLAPQLAPQLSVRVAEPQTALQPPYVYAGVGMVIYRVVACLL